MLDLENRARIGIRLVQHIGKDTTLGDMQLGDFKKKVGLMQAEYGIPAQDYVEFGLEMVEAITGFELAIPGYPREERNLLSIERQGRIARIILKRAIFERGIQFKDAERKIGNIAIATGLRQEDVAEFIKEIFQEVLSEFSETLGQSKRKTKNKGKNQ